MKKLLLIALLAQGDTGAITGRILGMDGLPAAGIRVAIASPDANGTIASDMLAGITTTDETGHYRIENVPPGRYGVVAGAVATPTFYPGTTNVSGAGLVSVERGSTKAGMDFALATPSAPQSGSQNTVTPAMLTQAIAQLNQQLALPGQMITGRVVVDGPVVSTFLPKLRITFSRMVGGSTAAVLPGGGWMSNRGNVLYSVSTDVKLDGSFKMELKQLPYRISVGRADGKRLDGFEVKSIALGSIDITKQELHVNGPVSSEIVITLQSVPLSGPIKL